MTLLIYIILINILKALIPTVSLFWLTILGVCVWFAHLVYNTPSGKS